MGELMGYYLHALYQELERSGKKYAVEVRTIRKNVSKENEYRKCFNRTIINFQEVF